MKQQFNHLSNYLSRHHQYVAWFFIIFYIVGFFGLALPFSHGYFLNLFPVALLLSFAAILLFHRGLFSGRTVLVLTLIGIAGFIIEVAGVNTHLVFGNYSYGNALGFKLFNTPVLIAINWIMLSYGASSVIEKTAVPVPVKILSGSMLMLFYDIILEQIAPVLDMWYWENDIVPVQNYVAWFVISLIFQTLIRMSGIKTVNRVAWIIILIQLLFFISLIFLFALVK
jgi:bisanhydrobacterioruberin hydratase